VNLIIKLPEEGVFKGFVLSVSGHNLSRKIV